MSSGTILISEYNPRWPEVYESEASRIRLALGDRVVRLEHAGSTSVPGLAAKPVIDIVLVVADSADQGSYANALEQAGYGLAIREPDWFEHRMFRGSRDVAVNLHVFSRECPEVDRMLAFRDWLRRSAGDRDLYARTKRDLAGRQWNTVDEYASAKSGVVAEILGRALGEPLLQ